MRWIVIVVMFVLLGCKEDKVFVPKPRMYPKVDYPTRDYKALDGVDCNFTFQTPKYTVVQLDTTTDDSGRQYDCWFDLEIPAFNAELNFSYLPISKQKSFDQLVADAFKMIDKHNVKADYIEETIITNKYGVNGLKFKLSGPVASPVQFVLTDSTHHFLRGSLYFNSKVNQDSLMPILKYVEQDIDHLISTFQWQDME